MLSCGISTFLLSSSLLSSTAAEQNLYWAEWQDRGSPWQWTGPDDSAGYWLEQTADALNIMQDTYWNGTTWPTTIQWIGAVIDTILVSTLETYTSNLEDQQNNTASSASSAGLKSDIQKYFAQVEEYYDAEDVIQIFDSAYDDVQWVVLEWLEAIRFINLHTAVTGSATGQEDIAKYAHRAHIFYNVIQDQFNTSLCEGGVNWNPRLATYKNAITNELFVSSSIAMYLYFPGDNNTDPYPHPGYRSRTNATLAANATSATDTTLPPLPVMAVHDSTFLNNAIQGYGWFKSHNFTNAQGLIVDGFHISPNQTKCDERNEMVYSYNQGVILGGLRGLWEATSDTSYLSHGYALISTVINATGWNENNAADAAKWAGLGRNGILEDYCDASANCSQDNYIFKGVFFENLSQFCQPLPTDEPQVEGVTHLASIALAQYHDQQCQSYAGWIQHNAHAALSTRNASGLMGEWWGAAYINQTQLQSNEFAVELPPGCIDIRNQPWLLETPLWACDGREGRSVYNIYEKRVAEMLKARSAIRRQAAVEDIRTVETQAQGLSVLRAAEQIRRQA